MKLFSFNHDEDYGHEWTIKLLSIDKFSLVVFTIDWSEWWDNFSLGTTVQISNKHPLATFWFYFGKLSLWLELLHPSSKPFPWPPETIELTDYEKKG
jgi:uncharacterized protein YndB with AHSA1/START domain